MNIKLLFFFFHFQILLKCIHRCQYLWCSRKGPAGRSFGMPWPNVPQNEHLGSITWSVNPCACGSQQEELKSVYCKGFCVSLILFTVYSFLVSTSVRVLEGWKGREWHYSIAPQNDDPNLVLRDSLLLLASLVFADKRTNSLLSSLPGWCWSLWL